MSNPSHANKYKQTSVTTANRGQLLLMLYEAAILNLKKAIAAIEKQDVKTKGIHITKTHDILNELQNTLDFNSGGQIATDLDRLYQFMIEQLIQANLTHSAEKLSSILKLLETLLSGWKVAVEQVNQASASPKPGDK